MRKSKDNIKYIEKELKKGIKYKKSYQKLADSLGTSRQTISKWIEEMNTQGNIKPKVNIPHNKFGKEFELKILEKFDQHTEKLSSRFGDSRKAGNWLPTVRYFKSFYNFPCSNEHIRTTLIKNNRVTSRTKRKTKRLINKNIKKQLLKTKNAAEAEQLKSKLSEMKNCIYHGKSGVDGFRVEVDGCFDHWFGKEKDCLYFCIDSFSNTLINLDMEEQETNIGYLRLFKGMLGKHGKPNEARTDRRNGLYKGEVYEALTDIGISVSSSSDPTFKPNVERAFQNAQNLFPNLFMELGINSRNDLLERKDEIIDFYNNYYNYKMIEENCFIESSKEEQESFVLRKTRKGINTISHVHVNGKNMAPYNKNGKRIFTEATNTIIQDLTGNLFLEKNLIKYPLKEIENVIEDPVIFNEKRKLQHEFMKNNSFRKMYIKKATELNKKIEIFNSGQKDIEPIEISL